MHRRRQSRWHSPGEAHPNTTHGTVCGGGRAGPTQPWLRDISTDARLSFLSGFEVVWTNEEILKPPNVRRYVDEVDPPQECYFLAQDNINEPHRAHEQERHQDQECLYAHGMETAKFMRRNPAEVEQAQALLFQLWELAQRIVDNRQRTYAGWSNRTSHSRGRILMWRAHQYVADTLLVLRNLLYLPPVDDRNRRFFTNESVTHFVWYLADAMRPVVSHVHDVFQRIFENVILWAARDTPHTPGRHAPYIQTMHTTRNGFYHSLVYPEEHCRRLRQSEERTAVWNERRTLPYRPL